MDEKKRKEENRKTKIEINHGSNLNLGEKYRSETIVKAHRMKKFVRDDIALRLQRHY